VPRQQANGPFCSNTFITSHEFTLPCLYTAALRSKQGDLGDDI
jgi:hypothetical protein